MRKFLCLLGLLPLALLSIALPAGAQTCLSSNTTWSNSAPFPSQTGTFSATFSLTPSAADIDAIMGFSLNAPTTYTSMAVIVRFNSSGFLDARNGSAYASTTSVPYSAGLTYQVRFSVNISTHTYSVYVTPPGGSEITLATNFAFRSEQATVASLNTWEVESDTGSETACNTTSQLTTMPLTVSGVAKFTPSGAAIITGAALNFQQWNGAAWVTIGTVASDSNGNLSGTITVQPSLVNSGGMLTFQIGINGLGAGASFSLLASQFTHNSTGLSLSILVYDASIDAKSFSVGLLP
jgi:hypothetical protein